MSKPTRAEALSIVRELVIDAVQRHRPIVVAKTFAHRWTVDAILAAISEPEPLSEDDAAAALADSFVFSTCDERGWLPTNEKAAQSIYAAGLAIVRVRP